jgi:hypothetical protein
VFISCLRANHSPAPTIVVGQVLAERNISLAGSEFLILVTVKSTIFWDVMQYEPVEVRRRFEGSYCIRLHGRVLNKTIIQ